MRNRWMIVAVTCALGASPAVADPKAEAKQHMQAAGVAYKEGRFEDTLAELNKAYALDPLPELHYSIGQVYVKLNRCDDAILAYESFLASKPSRDRADLANQAIATCKAQHKTVQPPPPPPGGGAVDTKPADSTLDNETPPNMAPPPTGPQPTGPETAGPTEPAPATTRSDTGPSPWYKDKLGIGLTGGGAVLTIVGLVMYSSARGKADDAANAGNYGDSSSQFDDAKSLRTTSAIVTVLGLGVTGVGVWRFMTKRNEERRVAFVPSGDGGFVTYSGGF